MSQEHEQWCEWEVSLVRRPLVYDIAVKIGKIVVGCVDFEHILG